MLFFGPSFSHLICYFGYLIWKFNGTFQNKKSKFGSLNLGHHSKQQVINSDLVGQHLPQYGIWQ